MALCTWCLRPITFAGGAHRHAIVERSTGRTLGYLVVSESGACETVRLAPPRQQLDERYQRGRKYDDSRQQLEQEPCDGHATAPAEANTGRAFAAGALRSTTSNVSIQSADASFR
jgi:hypothetical protein